eukprot:6191879-Pleurochrysis_carterae.AAC.1
MQLSVETRRDKLKISKGVDYDMKPTVAMAAHLAGVSSTAAMAETVRSGAAVAALVRVRRH